MKFLQKTWVAVVITAAMIVAAVAIGLSKPAPAATPEPTAVPAAASGKWAFASLSSLTSAEQAAATAQSLAADLFPRTVFVLFKGIQRPGRNLPFRKSCNFCDFQYLSGFVPHPSKVH